MANNVLDLLLGVDAGKIQKPRKEVKIKSLSEALGQDVVFIVEALTSDQYDKIQQNSLTINGKDVDINMQDMQIFTIIEGTVDPNLKSKELREKFGAPTPKELVKTLLLSGEIMQLYNIISELSGFNENAVQEVKN